VPDAGTVLDDRLHQLVGQLHAAEQAVRAGGEDGVHDLRVAMRRLRSLLRTFRPLLDPAAVPAAERVREELQWAGGRLSAVRDLEVVHGRLDGVVAPAGAPDAAAEAAVEAEPDSAAAACACVVPASVTEQLARHRERAGAAARTQVDRLLASARYEQLLADLEALDRELSWERVTGKAARDRLRRDWRRVRRRARAADRSGHDPQREVALHDVRKAAKRARYAAEALEPAFGERAARMAALAERVQDALGSHRDTLLTRDLLHRLATDPEEPADREHVFALGRLHAGEEARGAEFLAAYAEARAELERTKHRRWLR
jgi:CHAD domain-containing protein